MWPYYGGKGRIAHRYPPPMYDTIIEPFAGAARYSLRHWEGRRVILYDTSPVVVRLWRWLQTQPDLMQIPLLGKRKKVPTTWPQEWRDLVGLCYNPACGGGRPRLSTGSMHGFTTMKQVTAHLHKIKSWEIHEGSYTDAPDIEATWFIDPPYQHRGDKYSWERDIDYPKIAEWCRQRRGQVIVCERMDADWLPFEPLCIAPGQRGPQAEAVWYRCVTRQLQPSGTCGRR